MVGEVSERIAVARTSPVSSDVRTRTLSAVVLAIAALAVCWAGPVPFAGLVAIVAAVMCWEWGRITRPSSLDLATGLHIAAVSMAVGASAAGAQGLAVLAVASGALILCGVTARGQSMPLTLLSGVGVLYVGLPAIALVWLRADESAGFLAVMFLFAIVWTTDTFAYVCGTLVRGPKLWPSVSPNKTWAGLIGGILFAGLAGLVFSTLIDGGSGLKLSLFGLMLSACAQTGDLAESWLKRTFQVKNASMLIPGHGGFMDRMDGVVAAATLAGAIALSLDATSPARALLIW